MDTIARSPDTMVVDSALLTDALPSDRLNAAGRPIGELRDELYRIPNLANALHVAGLWVQSVGVLALASWWGHPIGWVAAFLLMGRSMVRFAILGHEAAHRLLFSNRSVNDWVGRWLVAYPVFFPLALPPGPHGPPQGGVRAQRAGPRLLPRLPGRPGPRGTGVSGVTPPATPGWKNLKSLLGALRSDAARPLALRILVWQVALFVGLGSVSGHWWCTRCSGCCPG